MKYKYDHIIKILKERYGWTRIPLIKKKLYNWWEKIPHGPSMGE
tara:strand:- start:1386 stop:1517 length:132 start_codon:yes stop_codon:yes gene_type:complete